MSEQYVVKFPGLPYFWGYFIKPCFFPILIFLGTESSSSCVNCPSSMSHWLLIIFVIGSCVTFGGFPSKFSKCCFHRCIRSSWLVAFSLAFTVLFLLLTSFAVCHAIIDFLSLTESLILLIWVRYNHLIHRTSITFIRLPSRLDLTWGHNIVGSHAWIETHVRPLRKKMLILLAFPF